MPSTRGSKKSKKKAAAAAAAANTATDEEKEALKQQLIELQEQMKAQNRQVLAEIPGKKDTTAQEKFRKAINETIKQERWRTVKFVPHEEEEEIMVATKIIKAIEREYTAYQMQDKKERRAFVKAHLNDFATELNNVRAYVTSRIKSSLKAWFLDHKNTFPPMEKIMACATRNLDLKNEDDLELFEWYWEDLLVKATGNKGDWDYDKRWYSIISEAAPPNKPEKHYVPPETEAFAVLCIENHYKAWLNQMTLKAEGGKKTKLLAPKKTHEGKKKPVKEGNNIYMCGPDFETKWTETTLGSDRKGGYSDEGREVFNQYFKQIKNVRKLPGTKEFERAFLKILREKNEITAPSHIEHKAKKRRKKNKEKPARTKFISNLDSDFSVDSDFSEEGGGSSDEEELE